MIVKNITSRRIFLGSTTSRLRAAGLKRGQEFPSKVEIEILDDWRLDPAFDELVTKGDLLIVSFDPTPLSIVVAEETGTGGVAVGTLIEKKFTPTLNQTIFTLDVPFKIGGFARAKVNTVWYDKSDFFLISGTTFIWSNVGFSLDPTDDVLVWYETVA